MKGMYVVHVGACVYASSEVKSALKPLNHIYET